MVEWFHNRVEGLSPFPDTFHMVEDSNSQVHSIEESISSAGHTQGEQVGSRSRERRQHRSSGRQSHKSYSRSCGGSRGGSRSGSRGRAKEKSRSRYPRRHHDGHTRAQQAQRYNHSSSRRRRQSRAQNAARGKGRALRTTRRVPALSPRRKRRRQQYQVSFIEPRAIRSRSRKRSRSSASQTMREYLREMERDEGQALRYDWYIRASSRRRRRQQRGRRVSYREPRVTRSRTPGRFRSTLLLKENPRRMECYERQPLRIEQGIHPSPRRSERLQQGHQVSFIEPRVTRSQSRARSRSTQQQTLQENLRRMECDDGQALRPEQDASTSSECSEHHQQGRQIPFTEQVARN
ncbi:hypothetical protein HGM15179_013731 [Zosterops borbonicus]|uniref:Uncharacterized protein n=1 Tax=Zosterops borbonicus TaxID=364589 RepID=A0A8K1LGP9_9PASS|nr:hypothetical protein HGM15179_013731 [Zosterops borbonicus]